MKLNEADPNFDILSADCTDKTVYIEARNAPFQVYGFVDYKNTARYTRIPESALPEGNKGLVTVASYSSGGRIRFTTDSDEVNLRLTYAGGRWKMPHMTLTGSSGCDLYIDKEDGSSEYYGSFVPNYQQDDGFSACVAFGSRKTRHITINMPLYASVKDVFIGLNRDAELTEGLPYRNVAPVVYYGSSITCGASASRPGTCYTSIVSRKLNVDYVNLGFSGGAKGEDELANYIAGLQMSAFVYDYDHNAPDEEHLNKTHKHFLDIILSKHPDIPVVFVSRPVFCLRHLEMAEPRFNIIAATYNELKKKKDNVYLIDGRRFFDVTDAWECSVDGIHPNDLGFMLMADKIFEPLKKELK